MVPWMIAPSGAVAGTTVVIDTVLGITGASCVVAPMSCCSGFMIDCVRYAVIAAMVEEGSELTNEEADLLTRYLAVCGNQPVEEVKVGFEILKALGLRHRGVNIISCPSCARQGDRPGADGRTPTGPVPCSRWRTG